MKRKVKTSGTVKIGKRKRGTVFLAKPSTLSVIFSFFAMALLIVGISAAGIPLVWMVWYQISPETSSALAAILKRPIVGFNQTLVTEGFKEAEPYQPPVDPGLPTTNQIKIPAIGVETAIIEESVERYEEAFRQGVWRVPDFGDSFNREQPMILAAHRFGYLAWNNQYRRENSFYNLPKLKLGDQVEVIWGQRKYLYEIYAEEETEEITNYGADLILYTCKFLESNERIFKYGRLIEKGYFNPVLGPGSG